MNVKLKAQDRLAAGKFSKDAKSHGAEHSATTRAARRSLANDAGRCGRVFRAFNPETAPTVATGRDKETEMPKYSARDAAKNFGAVIAAAEKEAVIVSRYGRPRVAVVDWKRYTQMKRALEEKAAAHLVKKLEAEIAALDGGAGGEPVGAELKRLRAIRDMARSLAAPSE